MAVNAEARDMRKPATATRQVAWTVVRDVRSPAPPWSTGGRAWQARPDEPPTAKDIQTYKRAHGQDIKRRAKGEQK